MLSGNLSILNRVKLTNAVFGSRLFFSFVKIKVPKPITAIRIGAHDHVRPENAFNIEDFLRS
jgi:hypothetical protein